jgi:hypothetical protein
LPGFSCALGALPEPKAFGRSRFWMRGGRLFTPSGITKRVGQTFVGAWLLDQSVISRASLRFCASGQALIRAQGLETSQM